MNLDLFSNLALREDIATGTIPLEQFAASLNDVIQDTGPEVYRDPKLFFESSHPSVGMRELLNDALGRLGGTKPGARSVLRLETTLGGGKTHSLISLYHAARGHLPPDRLAEFIDPKFALTTPVTAIATIIGERVGANSFPESDGVKPNTLLGYLLLQLGGRSGYEAIRREDEARIVPRVDQVSGVIGDRPTLIMIDEIAFYLRAAKAVSIGDSNLAKQTIAALKVLIAAVQQSPRAFLVITTTETTDVFGDDLSELLTEMRQELARTESSIQPTAASDLPAILRRRLFARAADRSVIDAVAESYAEAATDAMRAGATLTSEAGSAMWKAEIERCYPFHPSLIEVLDKRLATMPNFQRTRGALRLVALGLRNLWDAQPRPAAERCMLFHLNDLNLRDSEIMNDVTSRVDRAPFKTVIEADIASPERKSHAELIDSISGDHYACAIATTTYYWSLTRDVPGVQENALITSLLAPGFEYPRYQKALDRLTSDPNLAAWYLNNDPYGGYLFTTEASPTKALQEHLVAIKATEVSTRATALLENLFGPVAGIRVRQEWKGDAIPDNTRDCQLVVYHWDSFANSKGIPPDSVPQKIIDDWKLAPSGGPRSAINRLVFVAPDPNSHEAMLVAVRRELGYRSLIGATNVMERFTREQQEKLKIDAKAQDLLAKVAIATHMSILLYPGNPNLVRVNLPVPSETNFANNQTDRVIETLEKADKIMRAGGDSPSTKFLRDKLQRFFDSAQSTGTLVERFAMRADLKIVLDPEPLQRTIVRGVQDGSWDYHDATTDRWATKDRPSGASIRIGSDTFIEPPGSAPVPKLPPCPLCGASHEPGPCRENPTGGGPIPRPAPMPSTLFASGAPTVTLRKLLADVQDVDRTVRSISFAVTELDKSKAATQLTRLMSMVPAGTKGVTTRLNVVGTIAFAEEGDAIEIRFNGSDAEFQPVKNTLTSLYGRPNNRDAMLKATLIAVFDVALPPGGAPIGAIIERTATTAPEETAITIAMEDAK